MHFLNIALGSAAEARYLCDLSGRLKFVAAPDGESLEKRYKELCAGLAALMDSLTQRLNDGRSEGSVEIG